MEHESDVELAQRLAEARRVGAIEIGVEELEDGSGGKVVRRPLAEGREGVMSIHGLTGRQGAEVATALLNVETDREFTQLARRLERVARIQTRRVGGELALADPTPGRTPRGTPFVSCKLVAISSTDQTLVPSDGRSQQLGDLRTLPIVARSSTRPPKAMRDAAALLARATGRTPSFRVQPPPRRASREHRPRGGRPGRRPPNRGDPDREEEPPPQPVCAGCQDRPPRHGSDYCSEPCRNAAKQRAYRARRAKVPEHEELVFTERAAGRLSFADAILWLIAPDRMRRGEERRTWKVAA
jgi:hypothetical protein